MLKLIKKRMKTNIAIRLNQIIIKINNGQLYRISLLLKAMKRLMQRTNIVEASPIKLNNRIS